MAKEVVLAAVRIGTDVVAEAVKMAVAGALAPSYGPDLALAGATGAGAAVKEIPGAVERIVGAHRRRAEHVADLAATEAGMTAEELVDVLLGDHLRSALWMRTVRACTDATEERLRALAGALATGALADDDAQVEESLVVVDALSQLDALHLRTMALLSEAPPNKEQYERYVQVRPWAWMPDEIYGALPQYATVMSALLGRLTAVGVIQPFSGGVIDFADGRLQLTPFGEACLAYLNQLAEQPATGSAAAS